MRGLPIVLLALMLPGCASLFNATIPPAQRRAEPSRRDQILATAAAVLRERGFGEVAVEPTVGVVRTEVAVQPGRVPCGHVTCRYRDAWVVVVDADATVSIELKRELAMPVVWNLVLLAMGAEEWYPPAVTQGETVKGVEADQAALLSEILQ